MKVLSVPLSTLVFLLFYADASSNIVNNETIKNELADQLPRFQAVCSATEVFTFGKGKFKPETPLSYVVTFVNIEKADIINGYEVTAEIEYLPSKAKQVSYCFLPGAKHNNLGILPSPRVNCFIGDEATGFSQLFLDEGVRFTFHTSPLNHGFAAAHGYCFRSLRERE